MAKKKAKKISKKTKRTSSKKASKKVSVTIYSTSTCPWCMKTKEFLKAHKIPFKDINVAVNEKALHDMVKKSGQMGVPVIDINGKIIIGYDEMALRKMLKL